MSWCTCLSPRTMHNLSRSWTTSCPDGSSIVNSSDRKSTRLNSSHSLPDALPILEYLIVHELVHLLEPTHNAQFIALMDDVMPRWQFYRQQLRSEEHTSELQSLPTRRSSDLGVPNCA